MLAKPAILALPRLDDTKAIRWLQALKPMGVRFDANSLAR